jgi:transcriptional regulator with XRE-family HTH domain
MPTTEETLGKLIGERVQRQRKALGMTQDQLEAASGVPQGSISRIERGVAENIQAATLLRFAQALGVSADYLLGLGEAPPPVPAGARG